MDKSEVMCKSIFFSFLTAALSHFSCKPFPIKGIHYSEEEGTVLHNKINMVKSLATSQHCTLIKPV